MSGFQPDSEHVNEIMESPNHDPRIGIGRPDILLLHYTGMESTEAALARLCDPQAEVSSHYLVFEDGAIWQLVPEARRARHAGVSSWEQSRDINSRSIGIEVGNPGHAYGYPEFVPRQIDAVVRLARDIVMRHRIRSDRVLGHSDVAPSRKQDPGEKFPWRLLHEKGVGLWVEPAPLADEDGSEPAGPRVPELQRALARYGYGIEATGSCDRATAEVVTAFQRHFRPQRVDGVADISTLATLQRLLAAKERLETDSA
jgi:N-acetylmuramoyl-L-alanine amidase